MAIAGFLLCGCEPSLPDYLDGPDHSIELPEVAEEHTRSIEPMLGVLVEQDRIAWTTSYLHAKWRAGLRRHFRQERTETNTWSAWREHRELVSALEKLQYFRESTSPAVNLEQGSVAAGGLEHSSKGYIQRLYDESFSVVKSVCWAHRFLDLEPKYLGPHCSTVPTHALLVVAQRDVPWSTVQSVVHTAAQFGIDKLQFAVDGQRRALDAQIRLLSVPGPPMESPPPSCALAGVSQTDAGLEVRYRLARIHQQTRLGALGHPRVVEVVEFVDPSDLIRPRTHPAIDWDGAKVLPAHGAPTSVALSTSDEMTASFRRMHRAFDRFPTCETAMFLGEGPECSECLTVERALQTLGVIQRGGEFDRVILAGSRAKARRMLEQMSDRDIVLEEK